MQAATLARAIEAAEISKRRRREMVADLVLGGLTRKLLLQHRGKRLGALEFVEALPEAGQIDLPPV